MRLSITVLCALACASLMACSPTFNWREVRLASSGLVAMLPCKPDTATRSVVMGRMAMTLHMMGCETGNALFAVTVAQPAVPVTGAMDDASELLTGWKMANLAALKARTPASVPTQVAGVAQPGPQLVSAEGQKANGEKVESRAVYFAQGAQLFYAVILADAVNRDVAESFFSGLRLQ